jgi:hypothetical protein
MGLLALTTSHCFCCEASAASFVLAAAPANWEVGAEARSDLSASSSNPGRAMTSDDRAPVLEMNWKTDPKAFRLFVGDMKRAVASNRLGFTATCWTVITCGSHPNPDGSRVDLWTMVLRGFRFRSTKAISERSPRNLAEETDINSSTRGRLKGGRGVRT